MPKNTGAQIIAGVLGLSFVIVLALIGRTVGIDLKNRFLSQRNAPTPSLNELVGISPTPKQNKGEIMPAAAATTRIYNTKGGVQQIPATGSEALLLSSLFLPAGYYLRRKS